VYEYDFGDGWEHDVTVKRVTTVGKPPRPRCVAGARACPPEDCGGSGGYENLLEALTDADHEEHESLVTWSNDFKPERFVLPKSGLDLREEMATLRALADGDDRFEEYDVDPDDVPMVDLPKPLVEAVLALDPIERASLAALIAASLANEIVEVRHAASQLAGAMKERDKKKTRGHRKRARS
jgi:hypothetical protein